VLEQLADVMACYLFVPLITLGMLDIGLVAVGRLAAPYLIVRQMIGL
jgi:hypothetical protein